MLLPASRSTGRHRATRGHAARRPATTPVGAPSRLTAAAAITLAATATLGAAATGAAGADTDDSSSAGSSSADSSSGTAGADASPAAREAWSEPVAPGTPCSASAEACVDLESQRAWLIEDGEVVRGPMPIASGGEGEETPVGHSLRVYRHDEDHVSGESTLPDGRPAPMPYSTFFADGGIAFHGGSTERSSAGCIHMETADAEAVFEELRNGDKVQVVNASEEEAARAAQRGT